MKNITILVCFLVSFGATCFQLNAATVVAGVPQGSSGKYTVSIATPLVMRFDVAIGGGVDTFQFNSFQIGISANNNSDPLTMSLQSTGGLDLTQQINYNDDGMGSGNSASDTLLTFSGGPHELPAGTYSLVFSVVTDSEWTLKEGYTSFAFADPANLAAINGNVTVSNFENASDGSVSAVPESEHFVAAFGMGLIGLMIFRSRNQMYA